MLNRTKLSIKRKSAKLEKEYQREMHAEDTERTRKKFRMHLKLFESQKLTITFRHFWLF